MDNAQNDEFRRRISFTTRVECSPPMNTACTSEVISDNHSPGSFNSSRFAPQEKSLGLGEPDKPQASQHRETAFMNVGSMVGDAQSPPLCATPDSASPNQDDCFLMRLKEEEMLPWKEIANRFRSERGRNFQIAALQMRYKRLREKYRVWEDKDVQALELAHEYWEKAKWIIISQRMSDFNIMDRWPARSCQRRWQELVDAKKVTEAGNHLRQGYTGREVTESDIRFSTLHRRVQMLEFERDRTQAELSFAQLQNQILVNELDHARDMTKEARWGAVITPRLLDAAPCPNLTGPILLEPNGGLSSAQKPGKVIKPEFDLTSDEQSIHEQAARKSHRADDQDAKPGSAGRSQLEMTLPLRQSRAREPTKSSEADNISSLPTSGSAGVVVSRHESDDEWVML